MSVIFKSDWLASEPFFYNTKRNTFSSSLQPLQADASSFHAEGLANYCDFGFSVFEQTPFAELKFLPPSAELSKDERGNLVVHNLQDPLFNYLDRKLSESDVIDLIKTKVQLWEASLPSGQLIVLPLSGGYDSRLLLWAIQNKERVRAFTYGISKKQSQSLEVVRARYVAQKFGVKWQQIELNEFNKYIPNWLKLYGAATHAHGMYHYEFYTKIREYVSDSAAVLSGIFGDVWAGNVKQVEIRSPDDLLLLGYTHGVRADVSKLLVKNKGELRHSFWQNHRHSFADWRMQTVLTIRLKMILISYLVSLPKNFGFKAWSPFLDIEVASAMLNVSQKRRSGRLWQVDFFKKVGLDLEGLDRSGLTTNTLDYDVLRWSPVRPLEGSILAKVVDRDYVDWINRNITPCLWSDLRVKILTMKKVGSVVSRMGLKNKTLAAYNAYLCLKPIEEHLRAEG